MSPPPYGALRKAARSSRQSAAAMPGPAFQARQTCPPGQDRSPLDNSQSCRIRNRFARTISKPVGRFCGLRPGLYLESESSARSCSRTRLSNALGESAQCLKPTPLLKMVVTRLDQEKFRQQHWEGSFTEYLDIVAKNAKVARNAFQRVYDMILSYGFEKYTLLKHDIIKYHFFSDPIDHGADAVFGLDKAIERLVDLFKSAAQGLGTDKRHPACCMAHSVGSAKSTIARLLKKGLEHYSRTDAGAMYAFAWKNERYGEEGEHDEFMPCPMHEEPLLLIPVEDAARSGCNELNKGLPEDRRIRLYGDVCPFCRKTFDDLLVPLMPGIG